MKKIKFLSVWAVLLLLSVSLHASESGRNTYKFEITPLDDVYLGARYERAWSINYGDTKTPVTVVKHKNKAGYHYAVHSEFFEVCYTVSTTGFGARKMKRAWCTVTPEINRAVLNLSEMERQRILTPNQVDDEMALGLIASYLPSLLNPAYTHLLN